MAKSTKRIVRATSPDGSVVERGSEKATYTHAAFIYDSTYRKVWFLVGFASSAALAEKALGQYKAPRFTGGQIVEVEVVTKRPS